MRRRSAVVAVRSPALELHSRRRAWHLGSPSSSRNGTARNRLSRGHCLVPLISAFSAGASAHAHTQPPAAPTPAPRGCHTDRRTRRHIAVASCGTRSQLSSTRPRCEAELPFRRTLCRSIPHPPPHGDPTAAGGQSTASGTARRPSRVAARHSIAGQYLFMARPAAKPSKNRDGASGHRMRTRHATLSSPH